ncbi:WD40 repeat domain-containing protein, partial [Kitasatospora sp. NPDC001119]
TLATGGADHIVQLWDTTTGKATATLTTNVNSVAFSPDGRTLATGGDDATVRLWDTTTGKTTATLTDSGFVLSVAFSPDGHTLASGGSNTTTRLWFYTEPDAAISAICAAVARDLTSEEKAAYLPKSSRPVCHS